MENVHSLFLRVLIGDIHLLKPLKRKIVLIVITPLICVVTMAFKVFYYTSDSLWKIRLVESIQSIHNSFWTWHDKCNMQILHLSCQVQTSAWLLSPLECSPLKQNGWTLRFCFWGWIMWKMYNKTIIEFGFRLTSRIIKPSCLIQSILHC